MISQTLVPAAEAAPGRLRPPASRLRGWLAREGPLVVFAGFVLSLVFNWQVVLHPRGVVAGDLGDPLLQAWTMAWNSKFFTADDFWTSNILYPSPNNVAFTDSLLGYLPLSLIGDGPHDAILRYNIAYLFACALAFIGAYALARQLGSNWQGAALAGVVFAWAPWRLVHNSHLNILSTGGIALALFALARGHGYTFRGGSRVPRPGWVLAGWLIATWQVTLGYAVGLPFIYLTGGIGVVIAVVSLVRGRRMGRGTHWANGVGMLVFLGVTLLITLPYLRVVDKYEFTRQWAEVASYSPNGWGLLTGSSQTWLWRGTFFADTANVPGPNAAEKLLLPGIVVIVVALAGTVVSAWRKPVRISLVVATVLVVILSLGAGFFGGDFTYRLLWATLPGWDALRTPGRLILWALLLLGLLAAGAVTALGRKLAGWRPKLAGFVLLLPALGALLEGVPAQRTGTVPDIPADLRTVFQQTKEPMLVLPIGQWPDYRYQLWSTEGFPLIANGNSSNFPPSYRQISGTVGNFPDNYSLAVLEKWGIRKLVVLKNMPESGQVAAALTRDVGTLPVTRTEMTDLVVFTLK